VLIDHGFHTHVPFAFRRTWCKLWAAVGLADEPMLREVLSEVLHQPTNQPTKRRTRTTSHRPTTEARERRRGGRIAHSCVVINQRVVPTSDATTFG
jgi:hypothetical protein